MFERLPSPYSPYAVEDDRDRCKALPADILAVVLSHLPAEVREYAIAVTSNPSLLPYTQTDTD